MLFVLVEEKQKNTFLLIDLSGEGPILGEPSQLLPIDRAV